MSEVSGVNERAEDNLSLPNDFSVMLDKVLSNPEILTTVASALSGASASGTGESNGDKAAEQPNTQESAAASVSAELPSLDADAMMQKLPQMMKLLSPMLSGGGEKNHASASVPSDKRTCLLLAIKPYLSPQRCEAIDYIVKFSKLSEILKTIN